MLKSLTQMPQAIGYLAGFLATVAFLPQVTKSFKANSAKDISLSMYVLFCTGVGLWLVYGVLISSWPVVISNFVTLALSGTVLVLKIKRG
jgi:MtN3 and saliva related transmembrane protein